MVTELYRDSEDFVVVKTHNKNAHNSISRCAMIETFVQEPSLQHLASHAAANLAPSPATVMGGERWGQAWEALSQGESRPAHFWCWNSLRAEITGP